jgi:hypothetical protein
VGRGGPERPEASYRPWRDGTTGLSRLLEADRPASVPVLRRLAALGQPQAPHRPEPDGFPRRPRPDSALHQPHQRQPHQRQHQESRLPQWLQAQRQRPMCSPARCRSLCPGPQREESGSRHWWRVGMARDKNTGPAQPFAQIVALRATAPAVLCARITNRMRRMSGFLSRSDGASQDFMEPRKTCLREPAASLARSKCQTLALSSNSNRRGLDIRTNLGSNRCASVGRVRRGKRFAYPGEKRR